VPFLSSVYTRRATGPDALNLPVQPAGPHSAASRMYITFGKVPATTGRLRPPNRRLTHTLHAAA